MAQIAKVGRIYHSGYADILLPKDKRQCDGSCGQCGQVPCPAFSHSGRHAVAENTAGAKWGDLVEISPAARTADSTDRIYLAAYSIPVGAFLLGLIIGRATEQVLAEMLLSGLLLGVMAFVLVRMASRKFRLRRQLEYRIDQVLRSE